MLNWKAGVGALASATIALGSACGCSSENTRSAAVCDPGPATSVTAPSAAPSAGSNAGNLALQPEIPGSYRTGMAAVHTGTYAVSTANPLSTEAACHVLRDGGTAADALVAAQTVLGLVEPQSSGIGGGSFLMYYDAGTKTVDAYDGRETAPKAATENYLRWIDDQSTNPDADHTLPKPDARASGRSIGVPGVLRMLELAQREHGKLPWQRLFDPAVQVADHGFTISPRMAQQIAASVAAIAADPASRAYLLEPDGSPKKAGTNLPNPAMAKTLGAIATDGADTFYKGAIAEDIVEAVGSTANGRSPGRMSADDLAGYQAHKHTALCTEYRGKQICGMPPPSSGGITVAATLGILRNFDLAALKPGHVDRNGGVPDAEAVHLIAEAERLAYADRDKYVGDPDFIPLPGNSPQTLLDPGYLKKRAESIDPRHSMGVAQPGEFGPALGVAPQPPEHGTSHISVVDKYGNAAAMTTSVESSFGSFHMVDGFLLNNQLTDFSAEPVGADGQPLANRVQPGKRPRSSMSPTLVFDRAADGSRGPLNRVTGSPGGSVIIQFVVKSLVEMLDWGLDPQQAAGAVDFGATNSPVTNVGGEHPGIDADADGANDPLVRQLRAMGHQVSVAPQISGLSSLVRDGNGWLGGADPRREGIVLGDQAN